MNLTENKLYKILKKSQLLYFAKTGLFDRDYRAAKREMRGARKPSSQIDEEMKLVGDYWQCNPAHYVRYGLYDKELSSEELLDYIPPYFHYNFYNTKLYKGVDKNAFDNKYLLFGIFKSKGIPTPDVIARVRNKKYYGIEGGEIVIGSIIDRLHENNKLFIKPVIGAGGTGIVVINRCCDGLYTREEKRREEKRREEKSGKAGIAPEDIRGLLGDVEYIVQKGIVQRADFSAINPSSVNTLRVVTQWRDEHPVISVAVMRIGRSGKEVDNSHQGGLSVQVDVDTGKLCKRATAEHGGGDYLSHPDTGFVFEGHQIKGWDGIKEEIKSCAGKFPELEEVAWDVAVTDSGIQMIELNLNYGLTHLQCCCGGLRRVLNIYPTKNE